MNPLFFCFSLLKNLNQVSLELESLESESLKSEEMYTVGNSIRVLYCDCLPVRNLFLNLLLKCDFTKLLLKIITVILRHRLVLDNKNCTI